MESRRYSMGKLVLPEPPKPVKELTKQEILRNFDFPQLRYDYERFLYLIEHFYDKHGLSEDLRIMIESACQKIVNFLGAYPLSESNIRDSMKEMVEVFKGEMNEIKDSYIKNQISRGLSWRLRHVVEYSFDGITHFLRQFDLLIHSYAPGEKLPHAPTNWDRKLLFIDLVEKIQAESQSSKFPQYKIISGEMEAAGYDISRRTYCTWRKEWNKDIIRNLVQN